jgi:hypothetical protein
MNFCHKGQPDWENSDNGLILFTFGTYSAISLIWVDPIFKKIKKRKKIHEKKSQEKKVRFTNLIWQHGFLDKNFYNARKNKIIYWKQVTSRDSWLILQMYYQVIIIIPRKACWLS